MVLGLLSSLIVLLDTRTHTGDKIVHSTHTCTRTDTDTHTHTHTYRVQVKLRKPE